VQREHKKHRPCTTDILRACNWGFDVVSGWGNPVFPESRGWLGILIPPRLLQGRPVMTQVDASYVDGQRSDTRAGSVAGSLRSRPSAIYHKRDH
jgi:hypothetical protein